MEKDTIGKTVGSTTAALLGTLALLGMMFANEGPKHAPTVVDDATADAPDADGSPTDAAPRISLLVFEKTPVGEVLLERPDHGGGLRPVVSASKATLALKVSNEGRHAFGTLSVLLVAADGAVTWLLKSEPAPVGVDVALPVTAEVGPLPGRYAVLALFSHRALTDGDTARPLAQLRDARAEGKLYVPSFGSTEIAELRQELDLTPPG